MTRFSDARIRQIISLFFVIIDLPKKENVMFEQVRQQDCDRLVRIYLQFHIVNNALSDLTLEYICKEVC